MVAARCSTNCGGSRDTVANVSQKRQRGNATIVGNLVTGENQSYCFACFAMKHNGSRDLLMHTYRLVGVTLKNNCVCQSECDTAASVKCSDCEDFFCKACFKHIHRKGNRKLHVKYSFGADAEMCVRGATMTSRLTKCINCCDYFCTMLVSKSCTGMAVKTKT